MKIYVSKYLKRLKCLNKYLPTIIWVKTSWTWSRPIGREPCGCIWQSWSITSWLANSKSGKKILPLFEFYHFKCGRIHSKVSGTGLQVSPRLWLIPLIISGNTQKLDQGIFSSGELRNKSLKIWGLKMNNFQIRLFLEVRIRARFFVLKFRSGLGSANLP